MLSARLRRVVDALPLQPGVRVLEVGGAPGAAAREIARRVAPGGYVLVVDRSPRGTELTRRACAAEIAEGLLEVRCAAASDVTLQAGEDRYDLAFACRVGALDGRHPAQLERSVRRLRDMLVPGAPILVDTGDPLRPL